MGTLKSSQGESDTEPRMNCILEIIKGSRGGGLDSFRRVKEDFPEWETKPEPQGGWGL